MDDARDAETMRAFRDADPAPATTRELLLFLCGLAEFGDVALRRNEKSSFAGGTGRGAPRGHEVRALPRDAGGEGENANAKDVVATAIRAPREKLFVLAQVSMSDAREPNFADAPERARREAGRFAIRPPCRAAFATFAAAGYRPIADGRFSAVLPRRASPRRSPRGGGTTPDASVAVRAARRRG